MGTNRPGAVCAVYLGEFWGPTPAEAPASCSYFSSTRSWEARGASPWDVSGVEGRTVSETDPSAVNGEAGFGKKRSTLDCKASQGFPHRCSLCLVPHSTGHSRNGGQGEGMWVTVSVIITTFPPRGHHYKVECLLLKPITPNFVLFMAILNSS